jgi:guanylate kinase
MSSDGLERGLLFVISAPSGTGKTTVVDRLMQGGERLGRSRSYTSRPPRPAEADGVDYHFISRDAFDGMVAADAFLEWAEIFGHRYGTGRADTQAMLTAGVDVVLTIDVQGARQVRSRLADAVGIFVLPPSFDTLEHRLRGRNQDPEPAIARRLVTARSEVDAVREYEYVVVNDELDRCVDEIAAIIRAERARLSRRWGVVAPIIETFREIGDRGGHG